MPTRMKIGQIQTESDNIIDSRKLNSDENISIFQKNI